MTKIHWTIILSLAVALTLMQCVVKPTPRTIKHIDLPEEADLISKDVNNPTLLIGWINNDTLSIGFKH